MSLKNHSIVALAAFVILVGCSGGDDEGGGDSGYSGNTSAATVDDSNKGTAATAASVGATKAIDIETGSDASPFSASRDALNDLADRMAVQSRAMSSRATGSGTFGSEYCNGGGSISYSFDLDNSGYGYYEYSYNNCSLSYGSFTFNYDGDMYYELKSDGSFYYEYDLTYTYDGETYTLNATARCDSSYNCTYEDNFTSGGVSYRVTNVSVSGSNSFGYSVDATVYHEDLGYVEIESTGLITCSSGGFSSGNIQVTDSTGSVVMEVDFNNDCSTATVTYQSVGTTVSY